MTFKTQSNIQLGPSAISASAEDNIGLGRASENAADMEVNNATGCQRSQMARTFSPSLSSVLDETPELAFLPKAVVDYLRGVSSSVKWQDLIAEYIAFEKEGLPAGVSFLFQYELSLSNIN